MNCWESDVYRSAQESGRMFNMVADCHECDSRANCTAATALPKQHHDLTVTASWLQLNVITNIANQQERSNVKRALDYAS